MATLTIKVVPGSSRDRVVGRYGEAIKVAVSAPPEDGKANKAVVKLLADALGVKAGMIRIVKGETQKLKVVAIEGLDQADAEARLLEKSP